MVNKKIINFISYSILGSLNAFLNILLLPIYTNLLEPSSYGVLAYIDAIVMFIAVFSILGFHTFFIKSYKREERNELMGSLVSFLIIYNIIICLLGFIALPFIFSSTVSRISFILALVTNLSNTLIVLPLREIKVKEEGLKYGIIYGSMYLLQSLGAVLLVWKGYGILGRYISYFCVSVLYMFIILLFCKIPIFKFVNINKIKGALSLGIYLVFSNLSIMIINLSDRILLKRFVDFENVGVYSVGYTLGVWLSIIGVAFFNTFEPSLYTLELGKKYFATLKQNLSISYLLLMIPVLIIYFLGDYIYPIFLNEKYLRGLEITKNTVLVVVYIMLYNFYSLIAVRLNYKKIILFITILGAVSNIAINLILIPKMGIIAAAYSTIISYFLMGVFFLIILIKVKGLFLSVLLYCILPMFILGMTYIGRETVWAGLFVIMVLLVNLKHNFKRVRIDLKI